MKTLPRFVVLVCTTGTALALTAGPALAYDCVRVSASPTGASKSATQSGNWFYVSVAEAAAGLSAAGYNGGCFLAAYTATGQPLSFAVGVGLAGAHANPENPGGGGVLAANAPLKVVTDGHGIDHIDDTIIPAVIRSAIGCGIDPALILG